MGSSRGQAAMLFAALGAVMVIIVIVLSGILGQVRPAPRPAPVSLFREHVEQCLRLELLDAMQDYGIVRTSNLASRIEHGVPVCVDLPFYEEQGLTIEAGTPRAWVDLSESVVLATLEYPLVVRHSQGETHLSTFELSLPRAASAALSLDSGGELQDSVFLVSSDELASLSIPDGISLVLEDGSPVEEISLRLLDRGFEGLANPNLVGGIAYEGSPDVIFSEPVLLTISYKEKPLPSWEDEATLRIAWYDGKLDLWRSLPSTVDTDKKTVSAYISHFSNYGVVRGCSDTQVHRITFPVIEEAVAGPSQGYLIFQQDCGNAVACRRASFTPDEEDNFFEDPAVSTPYHKHTKQLDIPVEWGEDGKPDQPGKPLHQVPLSNCTINDWDGDDALRHTSEVQHEPRCYDENNRSREVSCPGFTYWTLLRECEETLRAEGDSDYFTRIDAFKASQGLADDVPATQDGVQDHPPYLEQTVIGCTCDIYVRSSDRSIAGYDCRVTPATPNTFGYPAVEGIPSHDLPGGFGVFPFRVITEGAACVAEDALGNIRFDIEVDSPSGDEAQAFLNPISTVTSAPLIFRNDNPDETLRASAWGEWDDLDDGRLLAGTEPVNELFVRVKNTDQDGCASARIREFTLYGSGIGAELFPCPVSREDGFTVTWCYQAPGYADHLGMDLANGDIGDPIRAVAGGRATFWVDRTGFDGASVVDIDHGDGWMSRYIHMESFGPGRPFAGSFTENVEAGDIIGTVGGKGNLVNASHLHFELFRAGERVDPWRYACWDFEMAQLSDERCADIYTNP